MGLFIKFVFLAILVTFTIMLLSGYQMTGFLNRVSKLSDRIIDKEKKVIDVIEGKDAAAQTAPQAAEVKNSAPANQKPKTPAPAAPPSSSVSKRSTFGQDKKHPFGEVDFSKFDVGGQSAAAQSAAAPPAAAPQDTAAPSAAEQMSSSSNPIIKTWAGYVSTIENMEK
jgi:hypothetical protein